MHDVADESSAGQNLNWSIGRHVEAWAEIDDEHGEDLRALLQQDPDAVSALFAGRLTFGTAGLRAPLGPGPRRMNRLVVRQTTAGLMDWLASKAERRSRGPVRVVIGYDARHQSKTFGEDVAAVVADQHEDARGSGRTNDAIGRDSAIRDRLLDQHVHTMSST